MMKSLIPTAILALAVLGFQVVHSQAPAPPKAAEDTMSAVAASTYEHLATAIIEIESTEDELVKSILLGYHASAQGHLAAAGRDAAGRVGHLEQAAAEVGNVANEGDKRIQAIRQRLAKAGHTHNTDAETKGDYIFVTNKEKRALLDVAAKIGKAGNASAADLEALGKELAKTFEAALAPE